MLSWWRQESVYYGRVTYHAIGEFNNYEIVARFSRVYLRINGHVACTCASIPDAQEKCRRVEGLRI